MVMQRILVTLLSLEYNCAEAEEDGSDVGWWGVGFRVPAWRLDVGPIASATKPDVEALLPCLSPIK